MSYSVTVQTKLGRGACPRQNTRTFEKARLALEYVENLRRRGLGKSTLLLANDDLKIGLRELRKMAQKEETQGWIEVIREQR